MEVILTIEDVDGKQDYVSATGADYEAALAAAQVLIPAGCKAIVIRKGP